MFTRDWNRRSLNDIKIPNYINYFIISVKQLIDDSNDSSVSMLVREFGTLCLKQIVTDSRYKIFMFGCFEIFKHYWNGLVQKRNFGKQ